MKQPSIRMAEMPRRDLLVISRQPSQLTASRESESDSQFLGWQSRLVFFWGGRVLFGMGYAMLFGMAYELIKGAHVGCPLCKVLECAWSQPIPYIYPAYKDHLVSSACSCAISVLLMAKIIIRSRASRGTYENHWNPTQWEMNHGYATESGSPGLSINSGRIHPSLK